MSTILSLQKPVIPDRRPTNHQAWVKCLIEQANCFVGAKADMELNEKIKEMKAMQFIYSNSRNTKTT